MEKFKQVSREALKKKMDKKEDFVLIDVLGTASFEQMHVPGAISIDGHKKDFVERVSEVVSDKNKQIIVYCASFSCPLSPTAAKKLVDAGYTNVLDFKGGLKDWAEGGYVLEGVNAKEFMQSATE